MAKAYAKTIKAKEVSPGEQLNQLQGISRENSSLKRKDLRSLAEKMAGDTFFYRNHYYPGGKEIFKDDYKMQTVTKYFPFAEAGPLFVDEWTGLSTPAEIEKKAEAMKKLGHRYLGIIPGMTELEATEALA